MSSLEFEAENPSVTFDSSNNAMVVWNAIASTEGNILAATNLNYAVRDDLDQSWSQANPLTDGEVDWQPSMAMLEDGTMIIWLKHSFIPLGENVNAESTAEDDDVYYLIHPIAPDLEVTSDDILFTEYLGCKSQYFRDIATGVSLKFFVLHNE